MSFKLKTVCEEESFRVKIDELRETYARIDEVWQSISWNLARDPLVGVPLESNHSFRVYTTDSYGKTPHFWVLYTYVRDDDMVYLWQIESIPENSADDYF